MNPNPWLTKIVLVVSAFALSGMPALAQANAAPQNQTTAAPAQNTDNGTVDPTAGPKMPAPSGDLPETPEPATQTAPTPTPTPAAPAPAPARNDQSSSQQAQPQEPLGTAAARRGNTAGGPASEPAGMAIAPAKQKQTRSLLIKIGAVAAAGAALALVYGLTRGTPSTPPGASTATNK